jgi:hypothetical protein
VILGTIEPNSSSTDDFETLSGQVVAGTSAQRTLFNDMVRAGITERYFDIADAVESRRNSGKWKVTGEPFAYVADGVHANQAGNLLIRDSGVIDPRALLDSFPARQVSSGRYLPTVYNTTNVVASAVECNWSRLEDTVDVLGAFVVDPLVSGAVTVVGMDLPIAAPNLGSTPSDVAGFGIADNGEIWRVEIDTINKRARFVTTVLTAAAHNVYFRFGYIAR